MTEIVGSEIWLSNQLYKYGFPFYLTLPITNTAKFPKKYIILMDQA